MSVSDGGMRWNSDGIVTYPEWTRELDSEAVASVAYDALGLSDDECLNSTTQFMAQGTFNRVYTISCPKGSYIMRISLPVDPGLKTESEVATMRLVASRTNIPVPSVLCWDSTCDNKIGFEWILMGKMSGKSLEDVWDRLSWESKVNIVVELAAWTSQLFEIRFDMIGSLYSTKASGAETKNNSTVEYPIEPTVGPLVSQETFQASPLEKVHARGPFTSSREWLTNLSELKQNIWLRTLEQPPEDFDTDDEEDITQALRLSERLSQEIEALLSDGGDELFSLHHDDISLNNILVTDDGKLTALIDWEFSMTRPLYSTAYYPKLLQGPESVDLERPRKENFAHEGGVVNDLYWIRLREYEQTHLRPVFLEAMGTESKEWLDTFRDTLCQKRHDLQLALHCCGEGITSSGIKRWLKDLHHQGEYQSLRQIMW